MFVEDEPERKIGVLAPRTVIEYQPYEFYKLAPPGVVLAQVACGLEEYSTDEVERVFAPLDRLLDLLMEHEIELLVQTGVPLPLLIGRAAYDAILDHIRERAGLPVTSQIDNVIAGMKHLGCRKVVVANKWSDAMNNTLGEILDAEGIALVGIYNKSLSPRESGRLSDLDKARLVYDLGAQALAEHPEADALYVGGGSWKAQPCAEQLETATGRPVISNMNAMVRHLLSLLGIWQPIAGHGRLLGSA